MRLPGIVGVSVLALFILWNGGDESLSGTPWTLVALDPASAPQPALGGSAVTVSFSENGNEITE